LSGDPDTSVSLDGSSAGQMTVTDIADLRITGDITLEAWVNPTDRAGFYNIGSKGTNGHPWLWYLQNTSGLPRFASAFPSFVEATTAPTSGDWSHLAVTRSGTTITHYLNGVANGTDTLATTTDDGGNFIVGNHPSVGIFKGGIDEVAVYGTALSEARLLAHYQAGAPVASTVKQLALLGVG
jgi:hypothetical protein